MQNINKTNENQKSILIVIFFMTIISSSIFTFSISTLVMQMILGIITISFILKKDYKLARLYIIIFIVSMIFVFLVYFGNQLYYGQPYYIGGSDDFNFEKWGYELYKMNTFSPYKIMKQEVLGKYHNASFYAVFIGILIKFSNLFGGYNTYLPRIMNVYFLIWICMIFEYLIKKYAQISDNKTLLIIGGFAIMPNIQYINSHVFRDTFNLLQVFLIILFFEKFLDNKNMLAKFLNLMGFLILIYFTYYTRINSLAFAGIISFLIIIEKFKLKKRYLILILVPIVLMSDILKILRVSYFIETYSIYVSNIAGDGLSSFIFGRPLLPIGIFLRFIYGFIIPFPNFIGLFKDKSRLLFDLVQLLIYLGVLVQIFMTPFALKRIFKFDWLSFSFLGCYLAVIVTTFTFRHVLLYYPFMVAMVVDGFYGTSVKNRRMILFLSVITSICFGLIYFALKIL